MSVETLRKVLELIYEMWFENYVVGLSKQDLIRETGIEENQIYQALEILESKALIQSNYPLRYVITTYGIDKREEMFPPATLAVKRQERRKILESLLELYQINVYERISSDVLAEQIQSTDHNYLLGIVVYLEQSGLVYLDKYSGGLFYIRLTAQGFQSFQDHITDNSIVMASAYRVLFNLENYMRKFIETKLTSAYGTNWWNKGIAKSIREKVNGKRKEEIEAGWKISKRDTDMEYLLFSDLERVITNNWKEVFESYFHDQDKVTGRLTMLEDVRNSIAHTRTLTIDAMNRLQQNYDDLMNLMNVSQTP